MNRFTSPRFPWRIAIMLSAMLFLAAAACSLLRSGSGSSGQDALLRYLVFIPDTEINRQWVSYGDPAAWYQSWDVRPVSSVDDLKALDEVTHAYWLGLLYRQTNPPDCLDIEYIFAENNLRAEFGFDVFAIDRFIYDGWDPDAASVMDFSTDRQSIAAALVKKGYTSQDYGSGWTLYSLGEDDQVNLAAKTHTEQMGNLNRILLSDHTLIAGKASGVVQAAWEAQSGKTPSLADDPAYSAAAKALYDPSLKGKGELLSVIWLDWQHFSSDLKPSLHMPADKIQQMREKYGLDTRLPEINVAAFAIRHSLKDNATYLILALVHPKGTDAKEASRVLEMRLEKADSLMNQQPLLKMLDVKSVKTYAVKAGGLPVSLAVLRVDDPDGDQLAKGYLALGRTRSWLDLVTAFDLLFLYTGE